jgi:tetratricopeptide (TPR) repeat protein
MLDARLKQDRAQRAFLAVAVRAYCERLVKEPERLPEAEQMMTWSTPIVEQTIKDVALLDKLTADPAADQYDRHHAAETQQCLAKILTWTNRAAQADQMWLRAIRSFEAIGERFMIPYVLGDYRQYLTEQVEQLVKSGRADEAVKLLHEVIDAIDKLSAEHPSSAELYRAFQVDILFQLTAILVAGGRAQEAVEESRKSVDLCQTLTEEYPGNLQYQQKLASALGFLVERLVATGQNDEAEATRQRVAEMWESFLAENPQDRQAREQLASALAEAADKSQANPAVREPLLRRALALHAELASEPSGNPGHLESTGHLHRHLAWLERSQGRLDEARQDFEKGAEDFAKLAADKIPQRDGYYRNFHADTLIHMAITQARGGHIDEAIATARQGVELCETLASEFTGNLDYRQKLSWAVHVLAQRLVAAGQPQDAVQICRRQISFCEKLQRNHPQVDFKPQLASAYMALCSSLTSASQIDEAQQAWEKAVEMGLSDANALNEFAWNLVAARDVEPALAALAVKAAQQATTVAPNDAMIRNTLGVALYRAGKWEDAVGSLAKAEELTPERSLAFNGFFLAMAHWQLDHKEEARKWYDRSVEWMEKNQPKNEELVRFRAEAEQLLGIPTAGPPSEHPAAPGNEKK